MLRKNSIYFFAAYSTLSICATRFLRRAQAGCKVKRGHAVRAPIPAIHAPVQTAPLHGTCRKAGRFVHQSALPRAATDVASESRGKSHFQGLWTSFCKVKT